RDGHRLVVWIAALSAASGLVAVVLARLEPHVRVGARAQRAIALTLVGAVLGVGVGGLAAAGGPARLGHAAYRSFAAPPNSGAQLSRRLLTLSSDGGIDLWRVAWRELEHHPLLGGGAGTYEEEWHVHRSSRFNVRDAHSLYLETLAELGPGGLVLLVF